MKTLLANWMRKLLLLRPKMVTDIKANTCSISIPDNIGLSQTGNLPAKLKLCVGARVMLTDISVSDRLINGSIGTVKHIDRRSKPLCCTIYVKIYDPRSWQFHERNKASW